MLGIALDRDDINSFWLVRVDVDWKTEIARQIIADFMPRIARIIAAHHVPVFLHKQGVRARWVHGDPMHAMTDLRVWIRNVLRVQSAIDWFPCFPAIVRAKRSGRRDRDKDSLRTFRIVVHAVQAHAAGAWLPFRTGVAPAQSGQFMPRLAAVF